MRLLTEQNFFLLIKLAKNNNPVTSKLSPIDSKLNFTYKMFLK
jgi:hypothetical protein